MIIDGKKIADEIQNELKRKINDSTKRPPCLAVILVGNHPPSQIYVSRKTQACESIGIHSVRHHFSDTVTEKEILETVETLNKNPAVDGILIQLPLPSHISTMSVLHAIDPEKDVDGFHPYNVGKMLIGETDGFIPCTPLGIKVLIQRSSIDLTGKHAVIIGRSNIVGKPMAALLMQPSGGGNATVTVAHSKTSNLKELCLMADLIIAAIGRPLFLTADMVKEGAIVIDVGQNKIDEPNNVKGYRIVGDVDYINVAPKCSLITPVPGGVGPMTIAMLLHNTFHSFEKRTAQIQQKSVNV
jgi:methylenetetrahydrofolate dehydrogenase (NADP+)/methenyltetrahydrofolate cyclohydrolase